MATYADLAEPAESQHGWIQAGNQAHEALNFLPHDGWYYGFVQHNDTTKNVANGIASISIEKLQLGARDKAEGITVVFCAPEPTTGKLLVTGWYEDATVYRRYISRPDTNEITFVRFKSKSAVLIAETDRAFEIPRARSQSTFGGVGQRDIWYGLNTPEAADFSNMLLDYIRLRETNQATTKVIVEEKRQRQAVVYERIGKVRGFIYEKGFCCEACGWTISKTQHDIWGSSFELHHLRPVSELNVGQKRPLTAEDFAVLCATCHRAIHKTAFASDVKAFRANHKRPK